MRSSNFTMRMRLDTHKWIMMCAKQRGLTMSEVIHRQLDMLKERETEREGGAMGSESATT